MTKTPIQWTDFSVNPFRFRNLETGKVGHHCTKISPGCKNCYSGKLQTGPYLSGLAFIAENKPKGDFFLDDAVLQQVLRRKKPARIFWCDMTDMFLEDYPDEWIDRCFAVMARTPHLTHQVLTKREGRMREYSAGVHTASNDVRQARVSTRYTWPLPNVWLGVSVEDQQRADERVPLLLQTPAAVRFLSVEPLLGPVDLKEYFGWSAKIAARGMKQPLASALLTLSDVPGIDWVIVGGESGPGARPCDMEWVGSIMEQCAAAGVACFVKQVGAHVIQGGERRRKKDRKGGDMHEWPHEIRVRQMPGRTTPEVQG